MFLNFYLKIVFGDISPDMQLYELKGNNNNEAKLNDNTQNIEQTVFFVMLLSQNQLNFKKGIIKFDSYKPQEEKYRVRLLTNLITMQLSKNQAVQSKQQVQWPLNEENQVQILKINKHNQKQLLYYTSNELLEQGIRVFHPCSWSISDFKIGRHLGAGKYGHVYLVKQRKTKQIMALKILSKKQIIKSDIFFQIRRQLQIHSHLNHPNILKMYGFFFTEKKIYIVLDYAPYGELYKLLQAEGKFNEQKSALYIYQVIQALKYSHSNHIIHRDIKPENILVSSNDQIKLTDYGWAVHTSKSSKKRKTFCGTPDYICPQIACQTNYDERLDIWCLGILTYELAAGFPPFQDSQCRRDLTNRIKAVNYDFPSWFSQELKDFIGSLLKFKPQDRMSLEAAEQHPWIKKHSFEVVKTVKQQSKNDGNKQNQNQELQI